MGTSRAARAAVLTLGPCHVILPETASDLLSQPRPRGCWAGRAGLGPHPRRGPPGRLLVSCRVPGDASLGGAGPAGRRPGGRLPGSQPVAHHCHPAHTLPAQPLLQHGADRDKHPGPIWQQRGPPVLSRSQPGTGEARRQSSGLTWVLGSQESMCQLGSGLSGRSSFIYTVDMARHEVKSTNVPPPGVVTEGFNPICCEPAQDWGRGIGSPASSGAPQPLTHLMFAGSSMEESPGAQLDARAQLSSEATHPSPHRPCWCNKLIIRAEVLRLSGVWDGHRGGEGFGEGGLPRDPGQVHSGHADGILLPKQNDQAIYEEQGHARAELHRGA